MRLPEQARTFDQQTPTPADNFRAMVRKIREFRDSPDQAQAKQLRRQAMRLGRDILSSLDKISALDQRSLDDAINRRMLFDIEIGADIYRVMHSTRAASALRIRGLLGLPKHGPINTRKRRGIY